MSKAQFHDPNPKPLPDFSTTYSPADLWAITHQSIENAERCRKGGDDEQQEFWVKTGFAANQRLNEMAEQFAAQNGIEKP
jgi:hypothetical protein